MSLFMKSHCRYAREHIHIARGIPTREPMVQVTKKALAVHYEAIAISRKTCNSLGYNISIDIRNKASRFSFIYGRMKLYLLNKDILTYDTDEIKENNNKNFIRIYIYKIRSLMCIYMSTLLDIMQGNRLNIIKLNMIQYCHVYE
jgi:hypothetical protein